MAEWFTTFFDSLVNDFWDAAMPPEATAAEVAYLRRTLGLDEGTTVLDVPCGRGRHALALARGGVRVTGIDLSLDAVDELLRRAEASGVEVDARVGDMRDLDVEVGAFDAAYSLGNSVGYFDAAGTGRFLAGVARALRPGGRFVLDTHMVAEALLPHLEPESAYTVAGITMSDRNRYDPRESRLDTTVTFERDGQVVTREMSVWVLTSGELVRLLTGAGFDVEALHGDVDGGPFGVGSSRLLLVARGPLRSGHAGRPLRSGHAGRPLRSGHAGRP
ncbi:MAG TPA: class I SAM-dependent methyltransferase [Acidimicrobiales bacterium]|nr:class I SAM-dependent methyltransferase [Acidimicrobiales bacterium]